MHFSYNVLWCCFQRQTRKILKCLVVTELSGFAQANHSPLSLLPLSYIKSASHLWYSLIKQSKILLQQSSGADCAYQVWLRHCNAIWNVLLWTTCFISSKHMDEEGSNTYVDIQYVSRKMRTVDNNNGKNFWLNAKKVGHLWLGNNLCIIKILWYGGSCFNLHIRSVSCVVFVSHHLVTIETVTHV